MIFRYKNINFDCKYTKNFANSIFFRIFAVLFQYARVAELVDALVSNTSMVKHVSVRPRSRVRNKNESS